MPRFDPLRLFLAGRWRACLADGPPDGGLLQVTDHLDLRLGARNLTAHLEDEAILPLLGALAHGAEALAAGTAEQVSVAFPRSRHVLTLTRRSGVSRVSIRADSGRAVVVDETFDLPAFRHSLRSAAEPLVRAARDVDPAALASPSLATLTALLRRRVPRHEAASRPPDAPAQPPASRFAPAGRAPLRFEPAGGAIAVRLGESEPARVDSAEAVLEGCAQALEAILRTRDWPAGRWELPLDDAARLVIQRERGDLHVSLVDRTGHGRAGPVALDAMALARALTTLGRAAGRRDAEWMRLRRTVAGLASWARALARGDERSPPSPRPPAPRPPEPAAPDPSPEPLPVTGLRHLAYRRRWRAHVPGLDARHVRIEGDRLLVRGRAEVVVIDAATGRLLWRGPNLSPVPGGPAGLVVDRVGAVIHLGLDDGRTAWRVRPFRGERHVTAACAVDGGFVLASDDRRIACLAATDGRVRWRAGTFHGPVLGLAAAGDVVWATGEDGFVHGWHAPTGRRRFAVRLEGEPSGAPGLTSAGLVVACNVGPDALGRVTLLDPVDGRRRWSSPLSGTVAGPPVAAGWRLLVPLEATGRPRLAALDLETGEPLWCAALGEEAGVAPLVDDAAVFVKGTDGRVSAFDLGTGEERWAVTADDPSEVLVRNPPPVLCRGVLLVPGTTIRALDPGTGQILYTLSCDELIPEWMHVWPGGDLVIAEGEAVARYMLGGHLALVQ